MSDETFGLVMVVGFFLFIVLQFGGILLSDYLKAKKNKNDEQRQ